MRIRTPVTKIDQQQRYVGTTVYVVGAIAAVIYAMLLIGTVSDQIAAFLNLD